MKAKLTILATFAFAIIAILLHPDASHAMPLMFGVGALKVTRKMPDWQAIPQGGAAGTALLKCPIGLTYHQIWTEVTNLTVATEITALRVYTNGKVIHELDAGRIDQIATFDRRTTSGNAIFAIDFDRFGLRVRQQEELTSLGTGFGTQDPRPITTLSVELDIDTAAATPTLQSRAVQSVPRPSGIILKKRKFTRAVTGAGDYELSDLPKGEPINRVLFFNDANNITRVQIEPDNYKLFDRSSALNTRIQADGIRTAQANLYAYDPTEQGNGTEQLLTADVQDLRFILTVDGALTLTPIVEYMGGVPL